MRAAAAARRRKHKSIIVVYIYNHVQYTASSQIVL